MNKENLLVVSFDIILHSGNARTMLHEAFELSLFELNDYLFLSV